MEEDPQDHDFDRRKDGPLQKSTTNDSEHPDSTTSPTSPPEPAHRPSIQIADVLPRRTVSDGPNPLEKSSSAQSAPTMANTGDAISAPPRHSTTIIRSGEGVPRRSTQMSRRTSRDFDKRTDGPFGRPSLTMTRRKSSGGVHTAMSPVSPTGGAAVVSDGEENKTDQQPAYSNEVPSIETMQSSDPAFEPEPPPLNYTLHTRKLSIAIFWSLILIDSIAMPIVLYFCLWYLTDLSPNAVFSIVTAALGGISIFEYFIRFRRLWKKGSTCRVIGARRMYLDWFHWNFTLAWVVIMIELIVGTVPEHPPIRLLSMPLASMLYTFGTELLVVDALRYFQYPAPCRISSIPKGAQLRPGIYSIIEDVIAVDGSGGTEYREALNRRYEASHVFRAMLRRLGGFWAVGAQGAAVLTTILVFTLDKDVAYVIGWSLPFVWAGIWTLGTWWYVTRKLAEEKKAWAEEVAVKTSAKSDAAAAV